MIARRKSKAAAQHPTALYPAFEAGEAFNKLKTLIKSGRPPIALIGAGASAKSGYPNWTQLIQILQSAASKKTKAGQWKKNLDDVNDAPWTAEVFARDLGPGGLGKLIRKEFATRQSLAEPHIALAKMPFPHFLTTNFDPSIEEALTAVKREYSVVSWRDDMAVSDFLINLGHPDDRTRVVYLHGRYDDHEDNIILTESAYVSRYIASDDARRKLMAVFMTHPVVFVGFSMNDPDLANLMREVTARLRAKPPAHFAIMSYKNESDREATRARMEGKFGVRPVFFCRAATSPDGDDYSNLVPLLEALADRRLSARSRPAASCKAPTPAEFDPEDPHKGRFGGLSEHDGRRVSARKIRGTQAKGYLRVALTIESLPKAAPIAGPVRFHLHPTFDTDVAVVTARDGSATLNIDSVGAFTAGIEIVNEKRRFEIDLAMLPNLPLWFRRQ